MTQPDPAGEPTPGNPDAGSPLEPATGGYPAYPAQSEFPAYPVQPEFPGYPTDSAAPPAYPVAPAYPQGGYQVPSDPLVTTPAEGFSGWFSRLFKVLGRDWRPLVVIALTTSAVPVAIAAAVLNRLAPTQSTKIDAQGNQVPSVHFAHPVAFVVMLLVVALISSLLSAVAQGGLVWTITRRSVGQPAPLGDALRYGLRNCVRLWGWSVVYGLMVAVGICACVLPGLYLLLAGCLYIPIALYQRGQSPIGGSFSLVNKNFGAALGRVALLAVMILGVQIVLQIPVQLISAAVAPGVAQVLAFVVSLVEAPLTLVLTVGVVLLFAELRARQHPLTSADLNAAL